MTPSDVRKLYSMLKLPKRPSKTSDFVDKIVEIPTHGYPNSDSFIKEKAKHMKNVNGSVTKMKRILLEKGHHDIVYRITPHNPQQWQQRIMRIIEENELGPLTETKLAVVAENHPNRGSSTSSRSPTAGVGTSTSSAAIPF